MQNPVGSMLQVRINTGFAQCYNLAILDILGKRLNSFKVQNGNQYLDISTIASGMYLLQLTMPTGQVFSEYFIKYKL